MPTQPSMLPALAPVKFGQSSSIRNVYRRAPLEVLKRFDLAGEPALSKRPAGVNTPSQSETDATIDRSVVAISGFPIALVTTLIDEWLVLGNVEDVRGGQVAQVNRFDIRRRRCERIAPARAFASAADGNPEIVPWDRSLR